MSTEGTGTDQNLSQSISDAGEAQSSLNQDFQIGIERRKEALRLETEILKNLEAQFQIAQKSLSTNQEIAAALSKQAQEILKEEDMDNALLLRKALNEEVDKMIASQAMSKDLAKELKKALEADNYEEAVKLFDKMRGEIEQTADFAKDVERHASSFAKSLGIASNYADTGAGKIQKFFDDVRIGNAEQKTQMIKKAFEDLSNPINLMASLLDIAIKEVSALEKASISLSKATGFPRVHKEIIDTREQITLAGGSMEDAAKSMTNLAQSMSQFSRLSKESRRDLAVLDFQLSSIGVSNAPKMFEIFSRNMRLGSDGTKELTADLILSGTAAGITATEMATNFESSFKRLALEGSNATEVFKDLAAQAKTAGVAVDDLINLGRDFDTFAKGAEKASKLNAILGTQISHMQMLHMSDEQRSMEMLRQVKMAVGNFDALSRSEKLYVAQAIAGGDVAKAQKLINMSTSEYLEKKSQMEAAAKTQDELRKLTEQLVPLMDKLKASFTKMALALKPVILGLVKILEAFSFLLSIGNGALLPFLGMIVVHIRLLNVALTHTGVAVNVLMMRFFFFLTIAQVLEHFFGPDNIIVKGFYGMAAGMMILAVATKLAGGKLGMLAHVFVVLLGVLMTVFNPMFVNFGYHMAIGILALAAASYFAGPGVAFLAIAMAVLLGSVALVVYAMTALMETFTGLFEVLSFKKVGALFLFAGAMYAVSAALMTFANPLALLGMITFMGFAASMLMIGIGIEKLGAGLEKYANAIVRIKSIAGELKDSLGSSFLYGSLVGDKTSVVIGENAAVGTFFNNDKLTIDVKMPEISVASPTVNVYIDGDEIRKVVREEILRTRR